MSCGSDHQHAIHSSAQRRRSAAPALLSYFLHRAHSIGVVHQRSLMFLLLFLLVAIHYDGPDTRPPPSLTTLPYPTPSPAARRSYPTARRRSPSSSASRPPSSPPSTTSCSWGTSCEFAWKSGSWSAAAACPLCLLRCLLARLTAHLSLCLSLCPSVRLQAGEPGRGLRRLPQHGPAPRGSRGCARRKRLHRLYFLLRPAPAEPVRRRRRPGQRCCCCCC